MKNLFVLILFLVSGSALASTQGRFDEHACGKTYHYESYGFGFATGFAGLAGRTDWNDEGCYRMGLADGKAVATQYASREAECRQAFNDAANLGFNGDMLTVGTPSECSQGGYIWGQSYLSVSARNGRSDIVGEECVQAYQKGLDDCKKNAAPSPTGSKQATYCYFQGYYLLD